MRIEYHNIELLDLMLTFLFSDTLLYPAGMFLLNTSSCALLTHVRVLK